MFYLTCIYFLFLGEILFNMHYPEDPPDFIFGPDDRGFLPNLENIEVSSYTRIAIDI